MKKGFTLVEVLVATMVFTICFAAIITCYLMVNKQTEKEYEYLRAESICRDIATYSDDFHKNWDTVYYGVHSDSNDVYLDQDFKKLDSYVGAYDLLSYSYNSGSELILSIKVIGEDRYLIRNLNYGGARYVTP